MTTKDAERIVRERYPDAVCRKMGRWYGYQVFAAPPRHLLGKASVGCKRDTEAEAWENAARRLQGE